MPLATPSASATSALESGVMSNATDPATRYSAGARAYSEHWAPVLLPHALRLIADLPLADARRVVDVGAGVGSLLPVLRRAAPGAHVIGCDAARGMIALAPPGESRLVCDARRLPLASASIDVAVMAFTIFFVPDPAAAFAEVRRVLRPGGAFALTSWHGEPTFPALEVWRDAVRDFGAPALPAWPASVLSVPSLQRSLAESGFRDVSVELGRFDHDHDPAAFLEIRLGTSGPWRQTLPEATHAAFLADVRARLAALPPAGFHDPTEILFARARVSGSGP